MSNSFQIPFNRMDSSPEVVHDNDTNTFGTIECRHCSGTGVCIHNDGTCRSTHYKKYHQWPSRNNYECRYCRGIGVIKLDTL